MEINEDDEVNIRMKDKYLLARNILLKNYQNKLLEEAKKRNTIIYLPTGSGKTLIAVHVLISRMKDLEKPLNEGGKLAFFVANTKVMTNQLATVLQFHTKFRVSFFNGDMNVDSWNRNKWNTHFVNNQVIVLTGEILRQILTMKFIKPSDITLIVFDECHHAVADHPYNLILKHISESTSEKPLLLGLSAVLLNSNPKKEKVSQIIQSLEAAFEGKVITENELEEIMILATNPTEKLIVYKAENNLPNESILKMYDSFIDTVKNMDIKSKNSGFIPKWGIDFKDKNKAKYIKNSAVQAKAHFEEFGVFGGSISALYFIILFEKCRLKSIDKKEIEALIYARTELNKIRHVLLKRMENTENSSSIIQFSSSKVNQLIQCIKDQHKEGNGKPISTLIFVHQRVTAIILAYLFKRLSTVDEEYSFIKADFIVGSLTVSKDCVFLEYSNQEIVKRFSSGSLNLLVATNILEEGVDISACNVVISFDFPLSYTSYFQSKGRARDKHSSYFMFVEEKEAPKKIVILNSYRNLGKSLMMGICEDVENSEEEDEELEELEKISIIGKTSTIVVDGITAIKVVDRYCSKLKQDLFSFLSPITWYIKNGNNEKKTFLQLPVNCPVRGVIEGEWKENKKLAKRSCFLVTLKKLYEMGELDDDLNYKSFKIKEASFDNLFPHYKKENIHLSLPQPGTKKRNQVYEMKFAESLSNSLPTPGVKVYLHVIDFTVAFDKPELQRKIAIYDILRLPVTFAIISTKKLCKIFQFPLFLDMGQINCDFLVNYDEMILTESEINDIKLCHFALFQKVTQVLKNSQVFDNRNKEHSFFVVPVEKNEENRFVLSWDIIKMDFCKNSNSALVRYNPTSYPGQKRNFDTFKCENPMPAEETSNSLVSSKFMWRSNQDENNHKNPQFEFTEAAYKYFVITPNYRNIDPPQYYIVSKLCHNLSPLSPFPRENFANYFQYYKNKYFIEITNMKQPLLRASQLFHCTNFNLPRQRKSRRAKEKYKEYEEDLIPELCDVIPFDRRYWIKALLLPTALNRIYHVYYVEEFRKKVVRETGLGICELPQGVDWEPLKSKATYEDEEEEGVATNFSNFSINLETSLPLSKLKDKTQKNTKVVLDPERHLYEIGLCDLKYYLEALDELDVLEKEGGEMQEVQKLAKEEILKLKAKKNLQPPPLRLLKHKRTSSGPSLTQMIEVCTAKSANDMINYERLETLGDSFLKFAATTFLFRNYSKDEGILSDIKGKIVGNRNLLYCGLEKGIQNVINVKDFVPKSDWNPPLLCVPERLSDTIIRNNIDLAVLYRLKIPPDEQFSGILSEKTFQTNEDIIKNHTTCWEMPTHSLLPFKPISDKAISDCVEAFIGSYLLSSGLPGAFEFLLWLGVLPSSSGSYSELIAKPYEVSLLEPEGDAIIMNVLGEVYYQDLEDILDYHFENKALLLEAITHPSYSKNRITRCYQRLELLGDAVIDFLITIYVYENCGSMTPGQITDIRSSLVNNITFACLVVRYELHKYLLSFSSPLNKAIENFVLFQVSRNHVVDDNVKIVEKVLILLNENEYAIGESVLVPKALGDLFESLAGAIFLDSGNSLETVWRVYYRLMEREIDSFTKNIPKNTVRLLNEICGDLPFYECKVVQGYTKVSSSIYYENREIKAYGFGANKKEGKRIAAKLLLNKILALKK